MMANKTLKKTGKVKQQTSNGRSPKHANTPTIFNLKLKDTQIQ